MSQLIDESTGLVLFEHLMIADRFFSRARGLLGRSELAHDEAMLIRPCSSIHTFFMRMTIHVGFVGKSGEVLAVHHAVRPWRMRVGPRGSAYVIEYSVENRLQVGMKLQVK